MAKIHRSIPCYVTAILCLSLQVLSSSDSAAQKWSILNPKMGYNLDNFCESWRINVELNNLRNFGSIPGECVYYIGDYMTSTRYRVDQERAVEQALLYLNSLKLAGDGKDAWVFDIDETLLSMVPYFKDHGFGADLDPLSFMKWIEEGKLPALKALFPLYDTLKMRGVKIIIITSRGEQLRDATAKNLVKVGYTGWTDLILRAESDIGKTAKDYKSERRVALEKNGYRILGNIGDQWSDILGVKASYRTFKLPNSLYYIE